VFYIYSFSVCFLLFVVSIVPYKNFNISYSAGTGTEHEAELGYKAEKRRESEVVF